MITSETYLLQALQRVLVRIGPMDIIKRFPLRKAGQDVANTEHMTTGQISAEVEAQEKRLAAIRRALFELKCEQVIHCTLLLAPFLHHDHAEFRDLAAM